MMMAIEAECGGRLWAAQRLTNARVGSQFQEPHSFARQGKQKCLVRSHTTFQAKKDTLLGPRPMTALTCSSPTGRLPWIEAVEDEASIAAGSTLALVE